MSTKIHGTVTYWANQFEKSMTDYFGLESKFKKLESENKLLRAIAEAAAQYPRPDFSAGKMLTLIKALRGSTQGEL